MKLSYCPECSSPIQQKSETQYVCGNQHTYWNNPKGAVGIIFRQDDKILYAIRAHEPKKGKLDFVGGYLNFNESPIDAAIRETKEETGVTIQPENLILIGAMTAGYIPNVSSLAVIYECHSWQGDFQADDDVAGFKWASPDLLMSEEFSWKSNDIEGILHAIKS